MFAIYLSIKNFFSNIVSPSKSKEFYIAMLLMGFTGIVGLSAVVPGLLYEDWHWLTDKIFSLVT